MMNIEVDWRSLKRILCIRLDAMGDVLMTGPAIRALKETNLKCELTLLTSPSGAAAAGLIPEVDRILVYEAPWMKATSRRANAKHDQDFIGELKREKFEAAVIFTVYSQNPLPAAMLCFLADIPRRLAHCRENPYQLLTDWVMEPEPSTRIRHEVRRQLDLVAEVGCRTADEKMRLRLPDEIESRLSDILLRNGVKNRKRFVVIHPGATAQSRRYPVKKFAAAAQKINRLGYDIFVTGTGDERSLSTVIQTAVGEGCFSFLDQLELADFACLLKKASLLISNNTGAVHVAASMGTPIVDLYALTNPQHTPWGVPHRTLYVDVPCRNCYKSLCPQGHNRCLADVTPGQIIQAAVELLNRPEICPGADLGQPIHTTFPL